MEAVSALDVVPIVSGKARDYRVSDYVSSHATLDSETGFQAFLIEQFAPELRAHFHESDQFQVIVGGAGTVGQHRVGAGVIHYSDAYTSYGPIRTVDADGLAYLTLRIRPAVGANFMPESRHKKAAGHSAGGHFTCDVDLGAVEDAGTELRLLGQSPSGARAYRCRLAVGTVIDEELVSSVHGRGYAVVLAGEVDTGRRIVGPRSVIPFDQGDGLIGVSAVREPATMAVVAFPDSA
jgi:hypothetical protein